MQATVVVGDRHTNTRVLGQASSAAILALRQGGSDAGVWFTLHRGGPEWRCLSCVQQQAISLAALSGQCLGRPQVACTTDATQAITSLTSRHNQNPIPRDARQEGEQGTDVLRRSTDHDAGGLLTDLDAHVDGAASRWGSWLVVACQQHS